MSTHQHHQVGLTPAKLKLAEADIKQYSVDHEPNRWSQAHFLLAQKYCLEVGESSGPTRAADKGIEHMEEAFKVLNEKSKPQSFAVAQSGLAGLYLQRVAGTRTENLTKALAAAKTAVRVCKHASFSFPDVALLHDSIGNMYADDDFESSNSRAASDDLAIRHYLASLQRSSMNDDNVHWANKHMKIGVIYKKRKNGEPRSNLKVAIKHWLEGLKVFTKSKHRKDWATAHEYLATSYGQLINSADYAASLAIMSKEAFTEEMSTLVEKCIASCNNALQVYSTTHGPGNW
jgi:hypothetical protein